MTRKNTAIIVSTGHSTNFQNELDDIVYPWTPNNNMCFNGDKFEQHRIGNSLGIEKHKYKDLTGKNVKEKEHIKDYGIHISRDLTWKKTN